MALVGSQMLDEGTVRIQAQKTLDRQERAEEAAERKRKHAEKKQATAATQVTYMYIHMLFPHRSPNPCETGKSLYARLPDIVGGMQSAARLRTVGKQTGRQTRKTAKAAEADSGDR